MNIDLLPKRSIDNRSVASKERLSCCLQCQLPSAPKVSGEPLYAERVVCNDLTSPLAAAGEGSGIRQQQGKSAPSVRVHLVELHPRIVQSVSV